MHDLIEALREESASRHKVFWHFRLTGKALDGFRELRDEVKAFLGDELDVPDLDPHVTILYMGEVHKSKLDKVEKLGREALETVSHVGSIEGSSVTFFPISDRTEGNQPIVLEIHGGLEVLHNLLLRKLAPYVTKEQFPEYKMHATLGYLVGRSLTADEYVWLQKNIKDGWKVTSRVDSIRMTAKGAFDRDIPVGKKNVIRSHNQVHPLAMSYMTRRG